MPKIVWYISYFTDDKKKYWWIGLNDRLSEGKYIWHGTNRNFNISLDLQTFVGAEPNNQGDEDCIAIRHDPNVGSYLDWNDANCRGRMPFICETNGNWS